MLDIFRMVWMYWSHLSKKRWSTCFPATAVTSWNALTAKHSKPVWSVPFCQKYIYLSFLLQYILIQGFEEELIFGLSSEIVEKNLTTDDWQKPQIFWKITPQLCHLYNKLACDPKNTSKLHGLVLIRQDKDNASVFITFTKPNIHSFAKAYDFRAEKEIELDFAKEIKNEKIFIPRRRI